MSGPFLFHSLHRAQANAVQAALAAEGLADVGQPMILFLLRRKVQEGGIANQRELADLLHVTAATVATSLKSLERLGYVERRADEKDSRCNRITLTSKGEAVVLRCHCVFQMVDTATMSGFTPQEVSVLDGYYRRMLDNLRRIGDDSEKGCECL